MWQFSIKLIIWTFSCLFYNWIGFWDVLVWFLIFWLPFLFTAYMLNAVLILFYCIVFYCMSKRVLIWFPKSNIFLLNTRKAQKLNAQYEKIFGCWICYDFTGEWFNQISSAEKTKIAVVLTLCMSIVCYKCPCFSFRCGGASCYSSGNTIINSLLRLQLVRCWRRCLVLQLSLKNLFLNIEFSKT